MLGESGQPKDPASAQPGRAYQLRAEAGGGAGQLRLPGPPQGVGGDATPLASPHSGSCVAAFHAYVYYGTLDCWSVGFPLCP